MATEYSENKKQKKAHYKNYTTKKSWIFATNFRMYECIFVIFLNDSKKYWRFISIYCCIPCSFATPCGYLFWTNTVKTKQKSPNWRLRSSAGKGRTCSSYETVKVISLSLPPAPSLMALSSFSSSYFNTQSFPDLCRKC